MITGLTEGNRGKGKRRIAYLTIFSQWMAKQGVAEIKKKQRANIIKSYKIQEIVESYNQQRPECIEHIENDDSLA